MAPMTDKEGELPEQSLHNAVVGWDADHGPAALIDAACEALIGGLDSPALRELAGASAKDSSWDIRELAFAALDELRIPRPGAVPVGHVVAAGGGVARRSGVNSLRLEVAPFPREAHDGFQVLVHVDGIEMTARAAGLGMDPYKVFVPDSRLAATTEPRTVPIARCTCGVYGCGSTDVTIVRDDDVVHWDWSIEVPMDRGVTFDTAQYDSELARLAADHSWETPVRTAGRLVLTGVDRERLRSYGLSLGWVSNSYPDPELFQVSLQIGNDYQVFLDTPWRGRDPEELAREVCATVARPLREWDATWYANKPALTAPPAIAEPSWRRRRF